MKRVLLGSTAAIGVGLGLGGMSGPALAEEGIRLEVGGFFKEAYMVVWDQDEEGEPGNEHNTDGFFNDAEIHFTGSTVLDNGLEVGARIELEGEDDSDQIDEAWIWFSGSFGEVRIGSEDDALANACVVPPGGTGNFSAFSPNQWGANTNSFVVGFFGPAFSNTVCTGVDDKSDAQKIVYITPNFAGFQLTASYTPDDEGETHADGVGPHTGMPAHTIADSRHNFSAYGTYSFEGDGWGLTAGLGGSWEGHVEEGTGFPGSLEEQDFYQAGINLTVGSFGIGIVGEYFNDVLTSDGTTDLDADVWVAGIGAAYTLDAWTFGVQYSHREDDRDVDDHPFSDIEAQQDRVVGTVNYALGPGINIDGQIGYTWVDSDPEFEEATNSLELEGADDYDALEIGIGTNITF